MSARHEKRRADGQILLLFAFALVPILLVTSLVIDGGYAWTQRRVAQNAADFAALAGARLILQSKTGTTRTDGAVAGAMSTIAAANGSTLSGLGTAAGASYVDGYGSQLSPPVHVGLPSSTASIPSAARGVVVHASTTWRPLIAGMLGFGDWHASAQATARFQTAAAAPCSICVLNGVAATTNSISITVDQGSIYVNGSMGGSNSVTITANNGSILSNGNLTVANSSTFTATNGSILVAGNLTGTNSSRFRATTGTVSVGGNLDLNNSSSVQAQAVTVQGTVSVRNSSTVTPAATSGGPVSVAVTDPLAFLSQPTNPNPAAVPRAYLCQNSTTCAAFTPGIGDLASVVVRNSATATLFPGIYNRITITNSSTVNLQPGTYYVAGGSGGITADNSSRIIGLGPVTIVLLDQNGMAVANSAGLQISAPSPTTAVSPTYPWPGVAIYAARGNTATLSLANSSSYPVTGAIYARDGTLTTVNSASVRLDSMVVVGTYSGANSSSVSVAYDADDNPTLPGGSLALVQ